ncbi:MAG TPA: ABC transporter permease [Candidatus Saccharimonadales bacterium]|nr:ABC transporter permease [Candidatus Saccharimonadales bacterium]
MKALTRGHVKTAIATLRANRGRSLLTMLGVVIGVASVVTVVSIGQGVKQQVNGQIKRLGPDVIKIQPLQIGSGQTNSGLSLLSSFSVTAPLTNKDYSAVASARGIDVVAPLSLAAGTPKGDNSDKTGVVIGTNENLAKIINQKLAYGVFFSADENDTSVAVLGHHAAQALFDENVPLGRSVNFRGEEFTVRGILDEVDYTPLFNGVNFNDAIFIPYKVAQQLTKNNTPIYEILTKPRQGHSVTQTAASIKQQLLDIHDGQADFMVLTAAQAQAATNKILDLLAKLISGVAAISLLVGGIGIMNVMLVSVTERMQEVGIRKAVGATNSQILKQFMTEAAVLSLAGGLLGILASLVVNLVLRVLTDLQPVFSWQIMTLAAGVAIFVGIIFGSVPALKAARKDPIDALRNE